MLAVMTLVMFLDGYDVYLLGRIAPALADSFGEPVARLTLVFLLQQVGLAVGSLVIGPLSDRYGRQRLLLASVGVFALLTLATVGAHSLWQVAVLRGVAGLFLAGVIPNATALLTEFAPPGRRAAFVSIAFTGFTAGGAGGALMAIWLLRRFGWHSGFWLGGILPLLAMPLILAWVPESRESRQTAAAAPRRAGDVPAGGPLGSILELGSEGRLPLTALLWLAYFIALGMIALMASWMATFFLKRSGIPLEVSAAYSLLGFAGGLAGTTTVGFAMDRFGRSRVLTLLFVADALALMVMGSVPYGGWAFVAVTMIWGYAQAGGQAGINALCAQVYPPGIRSSGVGWAFGIGRAGGVALPALGGLAFSRGLSLSQSFVCAGVLPLVVAAALHAIGRLDARRRIPA